MSLPHNHPQKKVVLLESWKSRKSTTSSLKRKSFRLFLLNTPPWRNSWWIHPPTVRKNFRFRLLKPISWDLLTTCRGMPANFSPHQGTFPCQMVGLVEKDFFPNESLEMLNKIHLTNLNYCWWFRNPAITSWYGKYPITYRVSYMLGGAGFLPSTVVLKESTVPLFGSRVFVQIYNIDWSIFIAFNDRCFWNTQFLFLSNDWYIWLFYKSSLQSYAPQKIRPRMYRIFISNLYCP